MTNILFNGKYPTQTETPTPGLAADYRLHCGFVCDNSGKLQAALPLPIKRRGWQGVALALLLGVAVGLLSVVCAQPAAAKAGDLPLRLHIVANSDSPADQTLKLQVRDAIVEYLTPLVQGAADSTEAANIVTGELTNLERLATGICANAGYTCQAEVGTFNFPAKRYGHILLPAGEYPALKLNLGAAAGHNWWCVVFPPLCFVDECGEITARDVAADDELLGARRVVRLKICEVFNQ